MILGMNRHHPMILTKIAEKYLADWLVTVSQEQDEKALTLIANINGIACVLALPVVLFRPQFDSLISVALLILMPQLIVLNLANTILAAGKKRVGARLEPKEFIVALLTTTLMYIDLFLLVSYLVRLSN